MILQFMLGPLRGDLSSRFFKADFTRDEVLLFPLVEAPLQVPYTDHTRNYPLHSSDGPIYAVGVPITVESAD